MSDSDAATRDEFFDSLLGDFLDESGQLLDRLNENLLQLDEWVRSLDDNHHERCDDTLMNEMFRSAHSLKGLSAMLGLGEINGLTHKVENVFDAARKDQLIVTGEVVELMFQAIDRLGGLVEGLKTPDAEPVECESVVEGISRVLREAGAERKQSSQADAERAMGPTPAETAAAAVPPAASEPAAPRPAAQPQPSARTPATPPVAADDPFAGVQDEAEINGKYLSIFLDEAALSLDSLTETLLALERTQTREAIENLLMVSHRIKGSAASVGLNRAAKLAHLMEDLLQDLRNNDRRLSPEMADAMLKCTDALRQYCDDLRKGGGQVVPFGEYAKTLLAARGAAPAAEKTPPAKDASRPAVVHPAADREASAGISDELRCEVARVAPTAGLIGEVRFQPGLALVGLKARLIYEKLLNLGEIGYFQPPAEQLDDLEELDAVSFALSTDRSLEAVRAQLRVAGVQHVTVEALAAQKAETPAEHHEAEKDETAPMEAARPAIAREPAERSAAAKGRTSDSGKPNETLRVDIERLDQLMNLAGQLVINKAHFSQIGDSLKSVLNTKHSLSLLDRAYGTLDAMISPGSSREGQGAVGAELENLRGQARRIQADLDAVRREVQSLVHVRGSINELFEAIHQLDRVTDGIHQAVMDTRMVPIGPLFTRFKRVVRDITRTNGKQVQLVIRGEKTELDKRMIDELGDPLIHMVRNAADHGIETPDVRAKAGKPREGTVTLDAFHRGNSILIQVMDDGKGLDADRLLNKALERGLVTPVDAEKMTRQQIYQLIWEPGLSTAEKITEVSGRGMGMDIVKSKIADLNGTIELDSTPGQGTTMTIKLPLTLAILPSLMVEIDGDVFAMPMESVAEIIRIKRQEIATIQGLWTARVREQVVSVVKLDEVFAWGRGGKRRTPPEGDDISLVIIGHTGKQIGMAVDSVLGEEDIVIKSLAENYRNVPGVAGASILGDGRVSLILDIGALIDMASRRGGAAAIA
jgi:two-component system chemotaxis sensor kinase CheA